MNSKVKNKSQSKLKKALSLLTMCLMMVVSLFTFAACKLTNDGGNEQTAIFDADGKLRIEAPHVDFNPYSVSGSNHIIDDKSGSFTWNLSYYLARGLEEQLKSVDFDQSQFLSNFVLNSSDLDSSTFLIKQGSTYYNYYNSMTNGAKPVYTSSVTDLKNTLGIFESYSLTYRSNLSNGDFYAFTTDASFTNIVAIPKSVYNVGSNLLTENWYGYITDGIQFTNGGVTYSSDFQIVPLYTPSNYLLSNNFGTDEEGNILSVFDVIDFPDFEVVVDGKFFTFDVICNKDYLDINKNSQVNMFKDTSPEGEKNLFKFRYRTGKSSGAGASEWIDCSESLMTYEVASNGEFIVRFNPMLEAGSKNRYIKIRALENNNYKLTPYTDANGDEKIKYVGETLNTRADSLYSSTVTYEAYAMTFETYSPNAVEYSYLYDGAIHYDDTKYYFHTQKTTYDGVTNGTYLTSVTGVFPEGRQIIIDRKLSYNDSADYLSDYALQNWTVNAKAETSYVLEQSMPNGARYDSNFFINNTTKSALYEALLADTDAIKVVNSSNYAGRVVNYQPSNYYPTNGSVLFDTNIIYEDLQGGNGVDTVGKLYVSSHTSINGYKFYSNYAKVRNFSVSGTFFDGDNFFTNENQYLNNVNVFVYNKNKTSNPVCFIGGSSDTKIVMDKVSQKRYTASTPSTEILATREIVLLRDNAEFTITGLEFDDFLIFEREGSADTETHGFNTLTYSFHSPEMEKVMIERYQQERKTLDVLHDSRKLGDYQNLAIIGTKYPEQSNLIVNVYSTNADDENRIQTNGLTLLQNTDVKYEIIKTSETFEDENGYITTNVIISLILPSNSILTGYNVETINNVKAVYYKAGVTRFVAFQKFDAAIAELATTDYYGNIISSPVTNSSGSKLLFSGESYSYHSTDTSSGERRETFILDSGNKSSVYKIVRVNNSEYELFDYLGRPMDGELPIYYSYSSRDILSSAIIKDNASSFLTYDGELYVYDHKDKVGTTTRNTYKQVNVGSQIKEIVESITGEDKTYTLFTYSQLDQSPLDLKYDADKKEPYITYNGNKVAVDTSVYQTASEIGIIGDVYPSLLLQQNGEKTQNIYFYYDVKKASNDKFYYYSPLGKQITVSSSTSVRVQTSFYFDNISVVSGDYSTSNSFPIVMKGEDVYKNNYLNMVNLDTGSAVYRTSLSKNSYYYLEKEGSAIKIAEVMRLGSEIYSYYGTNLDIKAFKEMMGSKIISSCYYYVRSLNDPIKAIFKQNIRTEEDHNQLQVVTRYFKSDKTQVSAVAQVDMVDQLYINPTISDGEGSLVDVNSQINLDKLYKYSNAVLDEVAIDPATSLPFGASSYPTTHFELTIGEDDYYIPKFDNNIFIKLTLYEIVSSGGGKTIVASDLYYNKIEGKYYKITSQREVLVNDDEGNYSAMVYSIDKDSPLTIKTVGNGSNLYNSIVVKSINSANKILTHYKRVATKSTSGYVLNDVKEELPTAFLVPTFYVGNNREFKQAYLGVDGSDKKIANFATTLKNIIEYKEYNSATGAATGENLYVFEGLEEVYSLETSLAREAKTLLENQSITVIGKYIQAGNQDESISYPSFSTMDIYDESEAIILGPDADGLYNHYYDLDYTTTNTVKEGFPGVVLLAGIPYPNPVLHFSVRHKTSEDPVINISFDIKEAYYVEIMGTHVKTEDSNLIRDFTTYTFKDTLLNLQLNDYIDRAYQILDKTTLKPVYAYLKNSDGSFVPFIKDEKGNPVALNIQDVGMNDNDYRLYDKSKINASGTYSEDYVLYLRYVDERGAFAYRAINAEEDVYIWETSTKSITDVASYDIHSYVQDKDGIIYFDSGSVTEDNIVCIGLKGIDGGATKDPNGYYNYDQVLIAGVTNAYRTKLTQLRENPLGGYQPDTSLSILDAYDSKDAYFLTGREAVVLTTNPTIKISTDEGVSTIYRFKEWQVYSRYNSEVLYFNKYVTSQLEINKGNAILTFYANNAGYYIFLPVYERVLSIDMGTAVLDGPINQGGSVEVYYKNGDEIDLEETTVSQLYFNELIKTGPDGDQTYQYGDIAGVPYLYFTGTFKEVKGSIYPVFSLIKDVYVFNAHKGFDGLADIVETNIFFKFNYSSGRVSGIDIIPYVYNLVARKPGIIPLTNYNGAYKFTYNLAGFEVLNEDFLTTGRYCLLGETDLVHLEDVINFSYNSLYFPDSILNEDVDKEDQERYYTPLRYTDNNELQAIDLSLLNNYFVLREEPEKIVPIHLYLLLAHMARSEFNSPVGNAINQVGKMMYDAIFTGSESICIKNTGFSSIAQGNIFTDVVAKAITHDFNNIPVVKGILQPNGLYLSKNGSLSASELVMDEDGNLYTTQQFKSCYIDRDSYVEIVAVPEYGYRLEGWYKCVYDENVNAWFTTDEKAENSEDIYSDEVIQAYYNRFNDKYYYVTNYYVENIIQTGAGTAKSRVYFFDSLKQEPAEVPTRMLNNVRGYFINDGSESVKNYVQVYSKGGNDKHYYYDRNFTLPVDTDVYEIEELTYIDAINRNSARLDLYTLNNVVVYRKMVTDEFGYTTERFYRAKTTGNIVVDGDTLKIKTLHSNVRYVAKFIETYNEYIFAEEPTVSGIKIEAVYYNSNDPKKNLADGSDPVIRTDEFGNNRTGLNSIINSEGMPVGDYAQNKWDTSLLGLIDKEKNPGVEQKYLTAEFMREEFEVQLADRTTQTFSKYSVTSPAAYNLLNSGFADFERWRCGNTIQTQTYRVNEKDPLLDGRLNLRSMNFDIDTNVYILVSVKSTDVLSIHSLGMNSHYELIPIIEPTDEFVEFNNAEKEEGNKVDYHFYLFRVNYNRNPENEYVNYIVHPKRGQSFAYDAMAGNFYSFYGTYFNIFDNHGNIIEPVVREDGSLSLYNYFAKLKSNYDITTEIFDKLKMRTYRNIAEGLEDLSYELRKLDAYYVDYVTTKADPTTQLKKLDDVYNAIKNLKDVHGEDVFKHPRLIYSGQRNFINLSTIPIYTYTIQALTIDSFEQNEEKTDFIYSEDGSVILHNAAPLYKIKDQFYTAAGYNTKTYVGYGTKDESKYVYVNDKYPEKTKFTFEQRFTNIGYSTGATGILSSARMEDLPFAQDTIILFAGATEYTLEDFEGKSDEILALEEYYGIDSNLTPQEAYEQYLEIIKSYQFVGWFEQKYDRVEKAWSDLTLMSKEVEYPYLSVAQEDTVVVAVYKKVVDVEFTYKTKELTVQLPNGGFDDLGHPINVTSDATTGITTIKGQFYFDSEPNFVLNPTGGYRLDSIKIGEIPEDPDAEISYFNLLSKDSKYLTFYEFNYDVAQNVSTAYQVEFEDFSLNGAMQITLPFMKEYKLKNPETQKEFKTNKLTIDFSTRRTVLTYFRIENYRINGELCGYDFTLYKGDETNFYLKTHGDSFEYNLKDSANNNVTAVIEGADLIIYGYFDNEIGDIKIKTDKASSTKLIEQWYINGFTNPTTDYGQFVDASIFDVIFEYAGELEGFNSDELFALDKNNSIYYARAVIKVEHVDLTIAHTFITDYAFRNRGGFASGAGNYASTNVRSKLTFNGIQYYVEDGLDYTRQNGALATANVETYQFEPIAQIGLSIEKPYVIHNGELYVFIGWYKGDSIFDLGMEATLVTNKEYIDGVLANSASFYEAKYCKAKLLDIVTDDNTGYVIDNLGTVGYCNLPEIDSQYYLVGYNPKIYITPATSYVLDDHIVKIGDEDGADYPAEDIEILSFVSDNPYYVLNINNPTTDLYINLTSEPGVDIVINQTLAPTIYSNEDLKLINSVPYFNVSYDGINGKLNSLPEHMNYYPNLITVPRDTEVKFEITNESVYGFVGWFIEGVCVSEEIDGEFIKHLTTHTMTVTEDLVVEARFTPYVNVDLISKIRTTDSKVATFSATISWTDWKTANTITRNNGTIHPVLAGTLITVSETRPESSDGRPYSFAGWNSYTYSGEPVVNYQFKKAVSKYKIFTTSLSPELYGEELRVAFVAEYAQTLSAKLDKEITIRADEDLDYFEDKANNIATDEFNSLFDVIIEYTDKFGERKTLSMSSINSIENLHILAGSTAKVSYRIDPTLADRYMLEYFEYTSYANNTSITLEMLANGYYEFDFSVIETSDFNIKAIFSPASHVTITRVVNDEISTTNVADLSYAFSKIFDSGRVIYASGILSDGVNHVSVLVPTDCSYIINHEAKPSNGCEFDGWFVDGVFHSRDAALTNSVGTSYTKFDLTGNHSFVADYTTVSYIKYARYIDGEEESNSALPLKISGNIRQQADGMPDLYLVQTTDILDATSSKDLVVLRGGKPVILNATHLNGYKFNGFYYSTDDGDTWIQIPSYESTYQTVAEFIPVDVNLIIKADYETEYRVSYVITTINADNGTQTDGATITEAQKYFTNVNNLVEFTLNIQSGYALDCICIDGQPLSSLEYNVIDNSKVSLNISSAEDTTIEVRIIKTGLLVKSYLSIGGTLDVNEIESKLNVNTSGLSLGGYVINSGNQMLVNTMSYNLGDEISLDASQTIISRTGVTYYFTGWYFYNTNGVAYSTYELSKSNTAHIIATKDLNIIAKYETSPNTTSTITHVAYEFYDDSLSTPAFASNSLTKQPVKNVLDDYSGQNYMFVGFYAKTYDYNGVNYIKLLDSYNLSGLNSLNGDFANIVGRFVAYNKVSASTSIEQTASYIAYNATTLYAGNRNTHISMVSNDSSSITYRVLDTAKFSLTAYAKEGYRLVNDDIEYVEKELIASAQLKDNSDIGVIATYRNGVATQLTNQKDKISNVVNTITTSASNALTINEIKNSYDIVVRMEDDFESSVTVVVHYLNNDTDTYTVTSTDSLTIVNVPYGVRLTLIAHTASHEAFDKYAIISYSSGNIDHYHYTHEIDVFVTGHVNIAGLFKKLNSLVVLDNDHSQGVVNVRSYDETDDNAKMLNIVAQDGYRIKDIQLFAINNGVVDAYAYSLISGTLPVAYSRNNAPTILYSEKDYANNSYMYGFTDDVKISNNFAIKVIYEKVSTLTIEVREFGRLYETRDFYLFADESPLTYSELESLFDPYDLNIANRKFESFYYNSERLTESSTIVYTDISNVVVVANYVRMVTISFKLKLEYYGSDQTIFNTPTNGFIIKDSDGNILLDTSNGDDIDDVVTITTYKPTDKISFTFYDKNGYYAFVCLEDQNGSTVAPYSSNIIAFETDTLNNISPSSNTFDFNVLFEELHKSIIIEENYEGSNFDFSKDSDFATSVIPTETSNLAHASYISYGEYGNIRLQKSGSTVYIHYPVSLTKQAQIVYMRDMSFSTVNTTDFMIPEGSSTVFYEKDYTYTETGETISLRLKNYMDIHGKLLADEYSKSVQINLKDFSSYTMNLNRIYVNAVQIYDVEFGYNVCDPNIKIMLNLHYLDNTVISNKPLPVKQIALSSNTENIYNSLIKVKLEEGISISVQVDIRNYTGTNEFYTMAVSTANKISDYFSSTDNVSTADWIGTIPQEDYIPVCNYHDADASFRNYLSSTGIATFHINVNKDLSFIADFLNQFKQVRIYPTVVHKNLDNDNSAQDQFVVENIDEKHFGDNFIFTVVKNGSKFTYYNMLPIVEETKKSFKPVLDKDNNKENIFIVDHEGKPVYNNPVRQQAEYHTYSPGDNYLTNLYEYIYGLTSEENYLNELSSTTKKFSEQAFESDSPNNNTATKAPQTSLHVQSSSYGSISVKPMALPVTYDEHMSEELVNGYLPLTTEEFDGLTLTFGEKSYKYNDTATEAVAARSKLLGGAEVTITAPMVEGYFFKCFMIVNNSYESAYRTITIGGETITSFAKTLSRVPHTSFVNETTKLYESFSTTLKIDGNVEVYALYEARLYVINLNQFEYDEEAGVEYKEDGTGRLTEIPTEAGMIKGRLVVKRGSIRKLTAICYPYIQYVGWTTTKEYFDRYPEEERFKVWTDLYEEEKGLSEEEVYLPENYKDKIDNDSVVLAYDKAMPGHDGTDVVGKYLSSYTTNNIYISNITNDLDLNIYFTALSYSVNIHLADVLFAYTYGNSENQDFYLKYADYIVNDPSWKNPSAGTYTCYYYSNVGSHQASGSAKVYGDSQDYAADTFTYSIVIDSKDPYVYTMTDINGTDIGYPTKIKYNLIDQTLDVAQKDAKLTYSNGTAIKLAKNSGDSEYLSIYYKTYYQAMFEKYGKYLNLSRYVKNPDTNLPYEDWEKVQAFVMDRGNNGNAFKTYFDSNQQAYRAGLDFGTPDQIVVNEETQYKIDNIYNYIDVERINGKFVYRLKPGLFTIKIDNEKITSDSFVDNMPGLLRDGITIDIENSFIEISHKVIANESGFPIVSIVMGDLENKSMTCKGTQYVDYIPQHDSEEQKSSSISGFNLGLFNNDDFLDPEYQLGDIDVDVVLIWSEYSTPVEASVTLNNHSGKPSQTIQLTGTNNFELDKLLCQTNVCKDYWSQGKKHVGNHKYEIQSYQLVVVKNGVFANKLISKLRNAFSKDDEIMALLHMIEIVTYYTNAASTNGNSYVTETGNMYSGNLAELSGNINVARANLILAYLAEKIGYTLTPEHYLSYHVIDVFEYYRKGIDRNFVNNFINADDIVISQILLQTHNRPQDNKYFKLFKKEIIWSASHGYTYCRTAQLNFASIIGGQPMTSSASQITSFNNIDGSLSSGFAQHTLLAGAYLPDQEKNVERVTTNVSIDISNTPSKNYDIVLIEHDFVKTPLSSILITVGLRYILNVGLTLLTGGAFIIATNVALDIWMSFGDGLNTVTNWFDSKYKYGEDGEIVIPDIEIPNA